MESSRLAAAIDVEEAVPYGIAVIKGFIWIHWKDWTVGEREFPAVAADAVVHLERWAQRQGAT